MEKNVDKFNCVDIEDLLEKSNKADQELLEKIKESPDCIKNILGSFVNDTYRAVRSAQQLLFPDSRHSESYKEYLREGFTTYKEFLDGKQKEIYSLSSLISSGALEITVKNKDEIP